VTRSSRPQGSRTTGEVNARVIEIRHGDAEGPSYRTTRYTVYPSGFARVAVSERGRWCIYVEDAGDGWAVRWRNQCLNYRNTWEFEPPARARSFEFLDRCRFSEQAAVNRAKWAVDRLLVDEMTFDDFVARVHEEAAANARTALARAARPSDGANKGLAFTRLGNWLLSNRNSRSTSREGVSPTQPPQTRIEVHSGPTTERSTGRPPSSHLRGTSHMFFTGRGLR